MTISVGDSLPDATLRRIGENGPEKVSMAEKLKGRKVVIFGLPGAFTSTCTSAHVPSFIRTKDDFDAKGVDEIICVVGQRSFRDGLLGGKHGRNGGRDHAARRSGVEFTKAIGMNFSAEACRVLRPLDALRALFRGRVVRILNTGDQPGVCEVTAGETLLAAL
jgi:peroxiredoxin